MRAQAWRQFIVERARKNHTLGMICASALRAVIGPCRTRCHTRAGSASAARTKANQAHVEALQIRTLDSVAFNAWLAAFTSGDPADQRVAERRLRPGYRPAFRAWLATDPAHNPNAPAGPGYMPQYRIPQDLTARFYDAKADAEFSRGSDAGDRSDKYIRVTVFLATVLFLVGIAG